MMIRFLLFVLTVMTGILGHTHTLYEGTCRVLTPIERSFTCQAAAFGAILPSITMQSTPLQLAPQDGLACATIPNQMHDSAIVLVRRGGCTFQQKLANVAAAGAIGMVIVNTEEALLQLGTLEYEPLNAFAVSVTRSEGDRLASLLMNMSIPVNITIGSELTTLDQVWYRIQCLTEINAPLVAFETFYAALTRPLQDLNSLIASIVANSSASAEVLTSDHVETTIAFLHRCSSAFRSNWEFAQDASFHAAIGAAVLLKSHEPFAVDSPHESLRSDILKNGAMALLSRGYYPHAAHLLNCIRDDSSPVLRCLKAFVKFLQGDLAILLEETIDCGAHQTQFDVASAELKVPYDNFLELVTTKTLGESDRHCVSMLMSSDIHNPAANGHKWCCGRRIHSHDDDNLQGDREGGPNVIKRQAYWYQSTFIEKVHHTLNIMGVFMDELGAFHESLTFFRHVSRLCEDWSLSTEYRQALAIPIVFDSEAALEGFWTQLEHNIDELRVQRRKQQRLLTSLAGMDKDTHFFARPEDATYLRYTITPPTMFIGYQGRDVVALQRSVFALRAELFPSLNSRYEPLNELFTHAEKPRRRRVAFVSTWFRNHSVGKLLLGIIKRLDRTKFHVMVYRSVHFLKSSDELTTEFHREADSYMELPTNQEDAIALLRHESIDVVVYPELGMDAWTVFLSHHRIAPVQCVFWGHPITTANPAIDYFITSEYFVSDFFEGNTVDNRENTDSWPGPYHGSSFSEQIVLFRGLSTFFHNKFPNDKRPKRPMERSLLHLPPNARLYVCPQTLMKLDTAFDAVLEGILHQDPLARIVLLSSPTQRVWTEQLRRRFRQRFRQAHRRIVFFSTLPYEDFMSLLATADVVLDPFPFGGGVTTLDALAVGTPVVTLPSAQTVPQLAAGFLRYIGVLAPIVSTIDAFITTAMRIATDATWRQTLQTQILTRHETLYEDTQTVDDWNTFLDSIHVAKSEEPITRRRRHAF